MSTWASAWTWRVESVFAPSTPLLLLMNRETVITKIVAVSGDRILPPCGRCRELMIQVDRHNRECDVLLPNRAKRKLKELLPYGWFG